MVRVKVPCRLIHSEKRRNSTFMKRRVAIKKMTMELGELCDIVTLLVCFGPRGQLETWPEDPDEVRRIIDHYLSLDPDKCAKRRRYGLATFFEGHLKTLQAELTRVRDAWLDGLPPESLEDLVQSLDAKLTAIDQRINYLRREDMPPACSELPLSGILDSEQEEFTGSLQVAAATPAVWGATHGVQHSPCTTPNIPPHSLPADPYMPAPIPDPGFNMDISVLDNPSPSLAMDFATYLDAATAGTYTSSLVDVLNPTTTAFDQSSYCHEPPLGCCSGIQNPNMSPSYNWFEAAGHSNPAFLCKEEHHQNDLLFATGFSQGGESASHSMVRMWSTSTFHDLPPTDSISSAGEQEFAPGADG